MGVCLTALFAWLARPAYAALADRRATGRWRWNYLVSLAWFLFSEFYGRPDLQLFYHISYIVPNLFLAVGANLSLPSDPRIANTLRESVVVAAVLVLLPCTG